MFEKVFKNIDEILQKDADFYESYTGNGNKMLLKLT